LPQANELIDALKAVLKARSVTYGAVARSLKLSEASVKRTFAARTFTLKRLDDICTMLGIEISDLARMVAEESARPTQLAPSQEKELVADPKLLLVAVHALNHWTLDDIVATYTLSKAECIRLLARLDRLGIIDLMPNNRIRVRVARTFGWIADGPIQNYFRAQVQGDFFKSRFDVRGESLTFVSGMLSSDGNAALQSRIRRLSAEFADLHQQDLTLPLAQRSGTSLLVAVRPWIPESFKRFRRKGTSRNSS
jgi:DNA-binding Xre family transcriptional regulator